jgi:hypothetical protein
VTPAEASADLRSYANNKVFGLEIRTAMLLGAEAIDKYYKGQPTAAPARASGFEELKKYIWIFVKKVAEEAMKQNTLPDAAFDEKDVEKEAALILNSILNDYRNTL